MITHNTLVLATDLDGTFLGGSLQERQKFYNYLQSKRDRLLLIFVTGRSLELTLRLYEEKNLIIPRPDYIIGDVGTTVYEGKTLTPVAQVQNWIADIWGNSSEFATKILVDEPKLILQPLSPKYRVSYYYKPDQNQDRIIKKIQEDFISVAVIVFGMAILVEAIRGFQLNSFGYSAIDELFRYQQRVALSTAILSSLWAPVIYLPLNRWWAFLETSNQLKS